MTEVEQLYEIQRGLGRVESSLAAIAQRGIDHQVSDDKSFIEFRSNIVSLSERISLIESSSDVIESHSAAILEIENRLDTIVVARKLETAERARDRIWFKWILLLVAALAGDHFTGSKIADLISKAIK